MQSRASAKIVRFSSVIVIFMMIASFLFNISIAKAGEEDQASDATGAYGEFASQHGSSDQPTIFTKIDDPCLGPIDSVKNVPKCLLMGVLQTNGLLLGASSALFAVVIDADKLRAVVDNPALYTVWGEVRDFLNIAFILFLLYSAFSIIFQVGGKYGDKKIILTIVLMALLVNFSYPIARFIVDASNSLMYTLISQLFPTGTSTDPTSILSGITKGSAFQTIVAYNTDASYSQLFAAIIFTFLFAITLLAVGVMFLIRIIALALLIIASPIAFVGNIAGKDFGWWDKMFKYAFFGPIMIFILHISIFTMQAVGEATNLASSDSIITSMANMAIPIIILWMGMGLAQQMGIAGADKIMGAAQKVALGAAKNLGGARPLAAWGFKKSGIPDATKQKWVRFKEQGIFGSDAVKKRADYLSNKGPLSDKNHPQKEMLKQADEYKKNYAQPDELKTKCAAGDAAACYRLTEDGDMDTKTYTSLSSHKNITPAQKDTIDKKLKKTRLDLVIQHKMQNEKDIDTRVAKIMTSNPTLTAQGARAKAEFNIATEEFGKLSSEQWNDQYWKDVLASSDPRIADAALYAMSNLDKTAQRAILTKLNANNNKALHDNGII